MKIFNTVCFISLFIAICSCVKKEDIPVYKNKDAAIEDRVEDLLKKMSLNDKILQLAGHGLASDDNDSLGIPGFKMSDGPLGVRTGKATQFPCGVSMAATWDTSLIRKVGEAMGNEVRAKGLNMLLGPCINIHRIPIGGRNFESFSEDPFLASRMGVSIIRGIQSRNVVACVKHYAGNEQEWERNRANTVVDERTLREMYIRPFEDAVKEADVYSVMSSYNKLNGLYASENPHLLQDILKKQWGFSGFVVSDWDATHSTVPSANSGLDMEMPQPVYFGEKLADAVKNGQVKQETIDDKVRRILRAKFRAGLFDNEYKKDSTQENTKQHQQIALEVARKSIVLLKNENVLPLNAGQLKSIALIGPNAKKARSGGGSSMVIPYYTVSPYEGIEKKTAGKVRLNYALGDVLDVKGLAAIPGAQFFTSPDKSSPGLQAEYFNNPNLEGKPALTRTDAFVDFVYNDGSPDPKIQTDNFSVRWTGYLVSPAPKKYTIYTLSDDGVRLYIDDKMVFENWDFHGMEKDSVELFLDQNKPHKIVLEYFDGQMGASIKLAWNHGAEPVKPTDALIAEAVEAARKSEVALVFVGLNHELESEAKDVNESMMLPNNQVKLIKAVAKANPRTVVILNAGVPLLAGEWINQVAGFVDAFYPGQEGGNALADILFGEVSPSGKLPFSYLAKKSDSPAFKGYKDPGLNIPYEEGIYVGYRYYERKKIPVQYPFGYGLSYTTFAYSNMLVKKTGKNEVSVTFDLKNTGTRAGTEVAQIYIQNAKTGIDRPEKELQGFARVELQPGESKTITVPLKERAFVYFDVPSNNWKTQPGEITIHVASSSQDVRLSKPFVVE